jgi:hypothetical protein
VLLIRDKPEMATRPSAKKKVLNTGGVCESRRKILFQDFRLSLNRSRSI